MKKEDKKKILVIDDEDKLVELMCRVFERKGFVAFGSTDGEEGLKIFRQQCPDITLIDIYMPYSVINGTDVLKKIKQESPEALCVMLTFMGGKSIIEECKKQGASGFIRKPVDVETLTKTVEDMLGSRGEASYG